MAGVSWRAQAGNTSEFALDLALIDDPDDVDVLDEDVRASWGTLSIWAAGVNLCSINGRGWSEEGTHWYLLGLAEWFIENWVPMLHEERLPLVNSSHHAADGALRGARAAEMASLVANDDEPAELWQDWRRRHSLRSGEPEALLPDLYIRRYGDNVELSVGAALLPGADTGATFPRIGPVRVPVVATASTLHSALSSLIAELLRRTPTSARLMAARTKLDGLMTSGADDGLALGWLAGIGGRRPDFRDLWNRINDGLDDEARERARALSSASRSPAMPSVVLSTPLSLLYGALSPEIQDADVVELYRSVLAAPRSIGVRSKLEAISNDLRLVSPVDPSDTPGEQGSALGEAFHAVHLNATRGGGEPIGVETFIDKLGIWVSDIEISDNSIKGVSILAADGTVGILINRARRGGRTSAVGRFTLAHELGHLVLDQGYSRELVVASGPWAPVEIEKRANAFAAAVLMPATLVARARASFPDGLKGRESVRALARTLDVSFSALVSRLQNLGLISFEDAENLRGE